MANSMKQIRRRKAYERLLIYLDRYQKILDQDGKNHIISKESGREVKIHKEVSRVQQEIAVLEKRLGINQEKVEI